MLVNQYFSFIPIYDKFNIKSDQTLFFKKNIFDKFITCHDDTYNITKKENKYIFDAKNEIINDFTITTKDIGEELSLTFSL